LEDEEGKANEDESEDLSTSVGYTESVLNISSAFFGCSHVGIDCNSHTNVSRDDGGESTDNEGSSCVELSQLRFNSEYKKYREGKNEPSQKDILLS
jgi:hypothetical protein